MDVEIEPITSIAWHDRDAADRIDQALVTLGFQPTRSCYQVVSADLTGHGYVHAEGQYSALLCEARDNPPWCELAAYETEGICHIVTSQTKALEWTYSSKQIERLPDVAVSELMERLRARCRDRELCTIDPRRLATAVVERLHQHWAYLHHPDPDSLDPLHAEQQRRLACWLRGFVAFYRGLGFLHSATALDEGQICAALMDFGDSLFEIFPGVEVVLDDHDDLESLFSAEELAAFPKSSFSTDLKLLCVLDPQRVWWSYRAWDFELGFLVEEARVDFARFLGDLERVSCDIVSIGDVDEHRAESESAEVNITVNGARVALASHYERAPIGDDQDLIAPTFHVVDALNEAIASSGYRFHLLSCDDDEEDEEQSYVFGCPSIMLLSDAEHSAIRESRGFSAG